MPGRGRPRITPEVYEARLGAYCARYAVKPSREGLPPYPAGRRETPQHREWISLYKAHSRLARRARGVCERCASPVSEGGAYCEEHRTSAPAATSSAAASPEDRRRLLKAQGGRCPVCDEKLGVSDPTHHDRATGKGRALMHAPCSRLVGLAETAGPEALDRLRAYLWPRRAKPTRD